MLGLIDVRKRRVFDDASMRKRGRPLVNVMGSGWGEIEGQKTKLHLSNGSAREIDVDVRVAYLP